METPLNDNPHCVINNSRLTNKILFSAETLFENKTKNKKEFNVLDAVLTKDMLLQTNLRNEVYSENFQNKLRPAKKKVTAKFRLNKRLSG